MTAKEKKAKKKKIRRSPHLVLGGKPTTEIRAYIKRIRKNVVAPKRGKATRDEWDHLIAVLEEGNALTMETKIAGSVARRAKSLGYVIRLSTIDEEFTEVWCGGFRGVPKRTK